MPKELERHDMDATVIGRIWDPKAGGPSVVTVRQGRVIDITAPAAPLVRDICEMEHPSRYVQAAPGRDLGPVEAMMAANEASIHCIATKLSPR
jgi:fumarylacetoacetate (FAA) hydrolase family protein